MASLPSLLHAAPAYLGRATLAAALQLALALGPTLLLAALAQPAALQAEVRMRRLAGDRAHFGVVGWIATAIHELGHALFALLFAHRVTRVRWFSFRPSDGARGQVEHQYDPRSAWQRLGLFFIGVGPIVAGTLLVALAARLLLGGAPERSPAAPAAAGTLSPGATATLFLEQLAGALRGALRLAARLRLTDWRSWLFAYAALVGGSAMRLSGSDVRSVGGGAWVLALLVWAANVLTLWAGAPVTAGALHASRALAHGDAALLVALVVLVLAAAGAATTAALLSAAAARGRSIARR